MNQINNDPKNGGLENSSAEAVAPQEMEQTPTVGGQGNPVSLKFDTLAKGIVTGVVVSAIVHTGRNLTGKLLKNPAVLFGLGLTTGYLAHKYRKEILATADSAAGQGRQFIVRQQQHLKEMLTEDKETDDAA